ncbi:MAG: V-type ATP synthase subunit A, partial [Methanobacteriota archaeon]
YTTLEKQYLMLKNILSFHEHMKVLLDGGVPLKDILGLKVRAEISTMKKVPEGEIDKLKKIGESIESQFKKLEGEVK